MMTIQALKEINVERFLTMEDAVLASASARMMETEFERVGLPVPEWLETAATKIREEIARRTHAEDLRRMREIQNSLEGLKTANEKKADLQAQLANIQKRLGITARAGGSK